LSHNYSKVSNNLFSFLLLFILHMQKIALLEMILIIVIYVIFIHPMFIRAQNIYYETFKYHIMNETTTLLLLLMHNSIQCTST
jgi:hypothetical protein